MHIAPKTLDVLATLVREAGKLVTKQSLLARIWPEVFVEEGILTVHISSLRKALGDANREPSFIETVSCSGYRFIAPISRALGDPRGRAEAARPIEAFEALGRGHVHLRWGSYFELPQAVMAFQQAIAIDPSYAAAHAGLARAPRGGPIAIGTASRRLRGCIGVSASRAGDGIRMRRRIGRTRRSVVIAEWDWCAAERSFTRALDINPNHTEA